MFRTTRFPAFILAIMSLLFFTGQGFTKQLFFDNFEEEIIGAEPSKWTPAEGAHVAKVIKDPTDSDNKVFEATSRLNGGDAGRHYVIGDESWTDYLVEWDWMIFADGYSGVAFRYQDRDNYYLVDRRLGGIQIQFYSPFPCFLNNSLRKSHFLFPPFFAKDTVKQKTLIIRKLCIMCHR